MSALERDYLAMMGTMIGSRTDYVQGGGGNMSAKLPDGGLLIKASGVAFKEMRPDYGLVALDPAPLRAYLAANTHGAYPPEAESVALLEQRTRGHGARPSMEAWFHTLLGTYVLHTHSVYVNILTCATYGSALVEELFGDTDFRTLWIPYANPGIALGIEVYKAVAQYEEAHGRFPDVIFLQNHGIIVTANRGDECIALHEEVNTRIRNYLYITAPYPPVADFISAMNARRPRYIEEHDNVLLFPDQIVFGTKVPEIVAASLYIRYNIEGRGLSFATIPAPDAVALREMESEKYRMRIDKEKNINYSILRNSSREESFMNAPLIIRHRVNTIDGLRKVDPRYGVEIDIRHDNRTGGMYLNHDPGTGDDLEAYLTVFAEQGNRFVILNTKETGLETRLVALCEKFGIQNYFLLDVEFPFIYRAAFKGVAGLNGRVAIRFSEAEPIEQALFLAGKFQWVWVDVNSRLPLDPETYGRLRDAGYKLALVCPERWGRPDDIQAYIAQMKRDGVTVDIVMTAEAYVPVWEKSGVVAPYAPVF